MRLSYSPPLQLTRGTSHHAFTSCATWRNKTYVAYREAETHHPFPLGRIHIHARDDDPTQEWTHSVTFWETDIDSDLRDPRLIATTDALYCLIGAYLPRYPRTAVSPRSSDNLIQTFLTYTEDGNWWAPLTPIYRPQYWIWSALPLADFWVAAAYHTGSAGETSSIALLSGDSLLHLRPNAIIYDGASLAKEGSPRSMRYRYPHTTVAEPVLYQPTPTTLACALRAEEGDKCMEIGVARYPYQDWRWWNTKHIIHPSAILPTEYGLLLAGRRLHKTGTQWDVSTALYHLDGIVPHYLLSLPSAHDTGYAGLCHGDDETVFLSYYSQHMTATPYTTPLPGAHVFLSTLTLTP